MKNLNFKKIALTLMITSMSIFLLGYQEANAQSNLVTVKSTKSYDATVAGFKKGVADAGMIVDAEINQGKILSVTGLTLKSDALFIGNKTVGKEAFSDNPAVGLALPIRVNIYEEKGVTYISYFTPSSALGNFKGDKVKMIGQELDQKMAMLTGLFSK